MDEETATDSSPGDAVSSRDPGEFDADEEIHDSHRPSPDLGETPMDTLVWYGVKFHFIAQKMFLARHFLWNAV